MDGAPLEYIIESSRLAMRHFTTDDCDAVLTYQSNPDVVRYVPWPVRDATMVAEAVATSLAHVTLDKGGDYLSLALIRKDDGQLIGQMSALFESEKNQQVEIGYVVNPTYVAQGYATEATRSLVTWLFGTKRFRRVVARIDERNVASRIVAEKVGLRQEAHFVESELFKGEWVSTYLYAVLRREWSD